MVKPTGWVPQEGPQTEFFRRMEFEVLYGGAAGGGKTDALIAEGGRQAKHPRYRAYFFRRTYPELAQAIDRAKQIFTQARWKEREYELIFPSNARYRFRHMEHEDDWRKYQGHEIHYCAFDELTQFTQVQYDKIKAWVRTSVPGLQAYIRCASNPKGIGHAWVKARFVDHGAYTRVVEKVTDPKSGAEFSLDRVFIPATVYDNKILLAHQPHYLAQLLSMPEGDRKAFLDGSWEVFEGQFFDEWNASIHGHPQMEIPKPWKRFGMLDYGYVGPYCYLQAAISPDGIIYVYRELYHSRVPDSDQAEQIAQACQGDTPEYIAAGRDLWHASGKGLRGQSTAETYQEVWKKLDFRTRLLMGDTDRIRGWRRVREYLQPMDTPDGTGRMAMLQVISDACPNLMRTMPLQQHDTQKPDDMEGGPHVEDHPPEALRLGLMSRPAPKPIHQPDPTNLDAMWFMRRVLERRRRAKYIGIEAVR